MLYIYENENRCAQLKPILILYIHFSLSSFGHPVQKEKKIALSKRCLKGRLEGFKVSSWFLKIVKLVE